MRIWALGDIHSNAGALEAALRIVDERPGDRLVILGDLLTYGAEPQRVLDLVAERAERGAVLILGNHDEVYKGMDASAGPLERMSPWIAASVKWTAGRIDASVLRDLPFQVEHIEEKVLFAHANPWFDRPAAGRRWAYLSTPADHRAAAEVLQARKLRVGVFGHTHQSRIVELPQGRGLDQPSRESATWAPDGEDDVLLLNAGAVGQPRNLTAQSTLLEMEGDRNGWSVRVHPVHYDVQAHLDKITALPVPEEVRARLARFFRPRNARPALPMQAQPTSSVLDAGR